MEFSAKIGAKIGDGNWKSALKLVMKFGAKIGDGSQR